MRLLEIIEFSKEYLEKYSFSKPRLESEKVISYILGIERIELYSNFEMELESWEKDKIKSFLREMARKRKGFDEIIKEKESSLKLNQEEKILVKKSFKEENIGLLSKSIQYLKKYNVENARLDAEYIFAYVLGVKRVSLMLNFNDEIDEEKKNLIRQYIMRRGKYREPLQYIVKEWEFYGYPIKVNGGVLIPRQDTEILVEQCIHLMKEKENPKILDIGTGSGAISIALAKEIHGSEVLGLDISDDALKVAVENRELNNVENLKFLKSDVFQHVKEKNYDLIVSNPPYIPMEEYEELMPEVKEYEPKMALTDGGDGYYFYRKISEESIDYLKNGGYLAFEVGYNQGETVARLMEKNGFQIVGRVADYGGIERVIIGRKEEI
ncbi:peptide chain release factor N(5)-glutamine methyltransferase [Fusobacterium perfoetens]|uniref:peptide chain release factor N(5)-glutamine methyltransferase n=1 Tax=Fusobacterium perfoetens TaxID=852 RepID=UPI0015A08820|nr:peptide chain release factor N(5)-glutamine methyltransferase [Fusobacterium perfoetens]MCF2624573.1 peptide chain release factor N(5)-glutamine methyltransferase [Fusobacterium perfoetens]